MKEKVTVRRIEGMPAVSSYTMGNVINLKFDPNKTTFEVDPQYVHFICRDCYMEVISSKEAKVETRETEEEFNI